MKKLFAISLILLACACTDRKGGGMELEELQWGSAELCIEEPIAPGEVLCYQIKFELDTLAGGGELAARLGDVLRDSVLCAPGHATLREAMIAAADSMRSEWQKELAEIYEPESEFKETLQYYYSVEGTPPPGSPLKGEEPVLSYQVTTDCYLGGAHGSHVVRYYNFDRTNGRLLHIGDIVPAEKEKLVLDAMEEKLCADWGARDLAELQEKTGITMLGDLYLTVNFLVGGDSIMFLFNQYEIAPYSAGLIGVTVKRP